MEIEHIFELVKESLYSTKFKLEEFDELRRLIDYWTDPVEMFNFFSENIPLLHSGPWIGDTIESAVIKTRNEAIQLNDKIRQAATLGLTDRMNNLSSIFKPLHNNTTKIEQLEPNKIRGHERNSWLRVYAIRVDKNLFVITGGGIKLTRTMNENAELAKELEKIRLVRQFLGDEENYDSHPIFGLFI